MPRPQPLRPEGQTGAATVAPARAAVKPRLARRHRLGERLTPGRRRRYVFRCPQRSGRGGRTMTDRGTSTASGASIKEAAIAAFKAGFRGQLLRPGDDAYDGARKIWNGMFDRRPALIARCAGTADVVSAVNFARDQGLQVAVRGGGHSFPGHSVSDGGLVIDLSPMKGIRVDPAARSVRAQAGAKWIDFDHETQVFGLATTGGTASDTGIAGLTVGGGLGWLSGKYGLTIDNLVSADVVTADGRFLTASATKNQDLFWGLRGGSGNLGVVTSFEYRLHAVGPTILGGMALYPLGKAKEVL